LHGAFTGLSFTLTVFTLHLRGEGIEKGSFLTRKVLILDSDFFLFLSFFPGNVDKLKIRCETLKLDSLKQIKTNTN
jgi:hypothetical protein